MSDNSCTLEQAMGTKVTDKSRVGLVLTVCGVGLILSIGLKHFSSNPSPVRDIVFLLETENIPIHNVQVLTVPFGDSLAAQGVDNAKVVKTINLAADLDRLGALLRRSKTGRKYLNHPTTIARFPVRFKTENDDFFAHLQYLQLKDQLTILIEAGGAGDANANHTNMYHVDGGDALELSHLLGWQESDDP
jgi:hypothetical protein